MATWQELGPKDGVPLRIAVVGIGAEATMIPQLHAAALGAIGLEAEIAALDVPEPEFEESIRHLAAIGFTGASVASPHKVHAARIAERFWVVRHSLGVANALSLSQGIFAQNTEVSGFTQTVAGLSPGCALVLGTGHGARSVVLGLMDGGWKVKIWNRNAARARMLRALFARYGELEVVTQPDPSGCQLVVNATPLGVKLGEQPPLLWNHVGRGTVFYDLVYRRVATEFARNATNRGLKAYDGRELVVEQTAQALEWWLDQTVPREPMRLAVGLR